MLLDSIFPFFELLICGRRVSFQLLIKRGGFFDTVNIQNQTKMKRNFLLYAATVSLWGLVLLIGRRFSSFALLDLFPGEVQLGTLILLALFPVTVVLNLIHADEILARRDGIHQWIYEGSLLFSAPVLGFMALPIAKSVTSSGFDFEAAYRKDYGLFMVSACSALALALIVHIFVVVIRDRRSANQ